jgi:hypothetical protein
VVDPAEIAIRLATLNKRLSDEGHAAAVRYVAIEPDPDFDDEVLGLVTWELAAPDNPDGAWPLDLLDYYCVLVSDLLEDVVPATDCLFRTAEELADDPKVGVPVPAAA